MKKFDHLYRINNPSFLKKLSIDELYLLSDQIRDFLIESLSSTGGHVSSNLGVIELTIALHYIFNFEKDKLMAINAMLTKFLQVEQNFLIL